MAFNDEDFKSLDPLMHPGKSFSRLAETSREKAKRDLQAVQDGEYHVDERKRNTAYNVMAIVAVVTLVLVILTKLFG
ncbi:hypothetical protein EQG49_00235 [Periweissella cryptocerci]|uniref:Uncharacterized protein n=1 Tax=Periweissella cryptocerci TaxID=2506420 RepID=A0A4P6YQW6_9LACO|nr:hypothetical protein [Periweissella cryptocerci]QBO34982.1 hypothetical protein EQG49_00235 [Periweissella cryptocerci]